MLVRVRALNNKLTYLKLSRLNILYFLFLITPIMDTINGWYVSEHGETGISIGTFYRLLILLFIFFSFRFTQRDWITLICMAYFPISSATRALFTDVSFMQSFTYGLKWMLPVIYILLFIRLKETDGFNLPLKVLDIWKYMIPGLLIAEYIADIGNSTYYDAGFRGYFYCTNDIGFSLTMMIIYSLYKFLLVKMEVKTLIPVVLNLVAIIILSTKSCLLFSGITVGYFMLKNFKKEPKKNFLIVTVTFGLVLLILYRMQNSLMQIVGRYMNFYLQVTSEGVSLTNIMGFLTSARTYRISGVISDLAMDFTAGKVVFGWKLPVFTEAIEMDWLDVFFQHGVIGVSILFLFYVRIVFTRQYKKPFGYMLIIAMICACFSGHVVNGALPSTVFSIIVGAAIYSKGSNGQFFGSDE